MQTTRSLMITLPADMAKLIEDKIASGEYASESDVVHDGLRSLASEDAAIEQWLREAVVPAAQQIRANPHLAVSAVETWAQLEAHMGSRAKKGMPSA